MDISVVSNLQLLWIKWKWKWSHSVMSDSLWPHGLWPTRVLSPWDFPGKNTGVGCHFLLQLWIKLLINIHDQVFLWTNIFPFLAIYITGEFPVIWQVCVYLHKKLIHCFTSGCKFLHSNQQYMRLPVALHLHQHLICQILNFSHYIKCVVISHHGGQVLFLHKTWPWSFLWFILLYCLLNVGLKQWVGKHIPFFVFWNWPHRLNIYFLIVWCNSEWSHLNLEVFCWNVSNSKFNFCNIL